jgi:hypothetical protein
VIKDEKWARLRPPGRNTGQAMASSDDAVDVITLLAFLTDPDAFDEASDANNRPARALSAIASVYQQIATARTFDAATAVTHSRADLASAFTRISANARQRADAIGLVVPPASQTAMLRADLEAADKEIVHLRTAADTLMASLAHANAGLTVRIQYSDKVQTADIAAANAEAHELRRMGIAEYKKALEVFEDALK